MMISNIATLDKDGSSSYTPCSDNTLIEFVRQIDIDSLSPREALEILYQIKTFLPGKI